MQTGLALFFTTIRMNGINDDLYVGRFLKSFMKLSAVVHERFGEKAEIKKKIEKIIKIRKK